MIFAVSASRRAYVCSVMYQIPMSGLPVLLGDGTARWARKTGRLECGDHVRHKRTDSLIAVAMVRLNLKDEIKFGSNPGRCRVLSVPLGGPVQLVIYLR